MHRKGYIWVLAALFAVTVLFTGCKNEDMQWDYTGTFGHEDPTQAPTTVPSDPTTLPTDPESTEPSTEPSAEPTDPSEPEPTEPVTPPHVHDLRQVAAKEPTCTESGWNAYEYCVNCSYNTKTTRPAAHNHTEVYTDPTTEADGFWTYTCACGDSYTVTDEGSRLPVTPEPEPEEWTWQKYWYESTPDEQWAYSQTFPNVAAFNEWKDRVYAEWFAQQDREEFDPDNGVDLN